MRRAIVIALFVAPALALAGPRKKTTKKKAAPPPPAETSTPDAGSAAPTPDTAPTVPATAPTGLGTTKGTTTPPLQSGTTPPQTTPAGQAAGSGSAAPATATDEGTGTGKGKGKGDNTDASSVDVDSLRQEYLSLRDELFKSRARANAVASQLYSTRVTIKFNWGSARYYGVSKASIRLDGATVYEDATGAIATDDGVRFDGYVAPGRHLVTFHVEATGKDDDSFTSSTESQVVVKAVANKDLVINAKGHDNGDIAYAWKRGEHGSYGLGIDVGVKTVASGAKK